MVYVCTGMCAVYGVCVWCMCVPVCVRCMCMVYVCVCVLCVGFVTCDERNAWTKNQIFVFVFVLCYFILCSVFCPEANKRKESSKAAKQGRRWERRGEERRGEVQV